MDAGFWPEVTAELCDDPWVTPERVTRTVDALQAKQARGERIGGKPIANVHALAVASLRGHREPVLQTVTMTHEERWGICPRCHSRPCECDEDGNPPWMADCE